MQPLKIKMDKIYGFSDEFRRRMKFKSDAYRLFREFLYNYDFIEVQTPCILVVPSDPVRSNPKEELFTVEWYSKIMYLRQSNQLHKQSLVLSGLDKIFEIGPFWRAERTFTPRHLSEAWGLDVEMAVSADFKIHNMILFIGGMLNFLTKSLSKNKNFKIDILGPAIKIFEYEEIYKLIKRLNINYEYGTDLGYNIECKISDLVKDKYDIDIFAVAHYPKNIKKFHAKSNGNLTETFDIFFKGWEISSGAIRQTDYKKIINGMKSMNLNIRKYDFYLDKFKKSRPHGGFCVGIDRFLTRLLNINDIKELIFYPRTKNITTP